MNNPKIEVVWNNEVAELHGETNLTGVTLRPGNNAHLGSVLVTTPTEEQQ